MKNKFTFITLLFIICFLFSALPIHALGPLVTTTNPQGLSDFVNLFINAAQMMLGVLGSLALLFFVYGGVVLLTSGGSSERVMQGKKVLTGAVIGIIITLGAWTMIKYASKQLLAKWAKTEVEKYMPDQITK